MYPPPTLHDTSNYVIVWTKWFTIFFGNGNMVVLDYSERPFKNTTMREGERERQRQRERQRKREIQTDRQTDRDRDIQTDRDHCSGSCSGSLEPESSCHDRDWIMELPMEADILTFTGIFTPEDASVASCWPALRAGLLCCNYFGQPGSVSKFPPFLWVKLWVGWVGRGYT